MPSIKLKIPGNNSRKSSTNGKLQPSSSARVSRKKRRITSDEEDEEEFGTGPESEEGKEGDCQAQGTSRQTRRPKRNMSYAQAPDPEAFYDSNLDATNAPTPEDIDIPDRAPTPAAAPSAPQRKRSGRKKAATVYSDEDDEYVDAGRKIDDRDDDFVVDEPPPKKTGKKGGAGGGRKGRRKASKEKAGGIGEIHIKDERKPPPSAAPAGDSKAGAGAKRRRETVSEAKPDTSGNTEATIAEVQPTSGPGPASQPQESTPAAPPPSKVRKLPPIKKNKSLAGGAGCAAPSSGPSTPSASAAASKPVTSTTGSSNVNVTGSGLPLHASLPRKPVQKTTDVDLSSPDIYNSLFKTGSGAPRLGVNSRVKEEERRKELMKMRDEARAQRMVNLQKNSFDLLAAQDKIVRFEAKLRARNSPALYPNHLGSSLRFIMDRRESFVKNVGLGCGGGNISGSRNANPGHVNGSGGRWR